MLPAAEPLREAFLPGQLHIVKARDFIRLNTDGTLDFENSRNMLLQIARAQLQGGIDRAVLDLRGSEGKLSCTSATPAGATSPSALTRR